jgi:peptidoglycan/LPS O-acetylase OafA/YrhL
MTNSAPLRFPLIDALRGIAALLVLIYHVIEISGWQSFPSSGIALLFRIGWIGVDLFFVISGFVIGRAAIAGMLSQPLAWKNLFLKGVCAEFSHFIFFRGWFFCSSLIRALF